MLKSDMQTFLPYADLAKSAQALDPKRLRSQTWECRQVLKALLGLSPGWANHCVTRLWSGHAACLLEFWRECWERRWDDAGYADPAEFAAVRLEGGGPSWLGDPAIHSAYRSHLLSKSADYGRFLWTEPAVSGYWAPDKDWNWKLYSGKLAEDDWRSAPICAPNEN